MKVDKKGSNNSIRDTLSYCSGLKKVIIYKYSIYWRAKI